MNKDIIDLIYKSKFFEKKCFKYIFNIFSSLLLFYILLLFLGTIVNLPFINYQFVNNIISLIVWVTGVVFLLTILSFSIEWKWNEEKIFELKEVVIETIGELRKLKNNNIATSKENIDKFIIPKDSYFKNTKVFLIKYLDNTFKKSIEIWINLEYRNLYFNFYNDKNYELRNEFKNFMENNKNIILKSTDNSKSSLYIDEDKNIWINIKSDKILEKILLYMKYIKEFLEYNNKK